MKAASLQEIKSELKQVNKEQLMALCLRLARFKKENKELLDYLLFQSHDLPGYITLVKLEIDEGFSQVNYSSVFLAKKTLRKILRNANKYTRYTSDDTAATEILLHYLHHFSQMSLPWQRAKVLKNMYEAQLKKIAVAIDSMHEDLQYEYRKQLNAFQSLLS